MRAVKIITIGIASVFLLSFAVAASAAQVSYDLKCEGNSSSLDGSNGETNSSPFAMTLHVDPDHSSFCQNSCETQEKISRILPSNIIIPLRQNRMAHCANNAAAPPKAEPAH